MLVLPTRLLHDDAPACLRMLQQGQAATHESVTVVDASALQHFDSSAIAVLLECRREASAASAQDDHWAIVSRYFNERCHPTGIESSKQGGLLKRSSPKQLMRSPQDLESARRSNSSDWGSSCGPRGKG